MYSDKATKESVKSGSPENRLTSTGVSVAELKARRKKILDDENAELQHINDFVRLKQIERVLHKEDIFIMDVNSLCRSNSTGFLIGEMTILRFTLAEGIKDYYHTLINPDTVPYGYGSDIKISCREYGLDLPNDSAAKSDYKDILDSITCFMKQRDLDSHCLPVIYTMTDKVEQIRDFLTLLCSQEPVNSDVHLTDFRIYKLPSLLCTLSRAMVKDEDEIIYTAAHAVIWLEKDIFMWTPRAGCKHHNDIDRALHCTLSRVKRWANTILNKTAQGFNSLHTKRELFTTHYDVNEPWSLATTSSGNSSLVSSTENLSFGPDPNVSPSPIVVQPKKVFTVGAGRGRGKLFELLETVKLENDLREISDFN